MNLFENRLSILTMHFHREVLPEGIRSNLSFLKHNRNVLPLSEALSMLYKGISLPPGTVSVVVDDAVEEFYKTGWPLFAEFALPVTLAIIPGLIPSHRREHLIAKLMRVAGHEYYLPPDEMLQRAFSWIKRHYPKQRIAKHNFNTLFLIARDLSEDDLIALSKHLKCEKASKHLFMSWDCLRELQKSGNVYFASHSMSHPRMYYATDEWLTWEINRPASLITEELGVKIDTFVYPYGKKYGGPSMVTEALKGGRFSYAILGERGTVGRKTNRYYLPRFSAEIQNRFLFLLYASPEMATSIYSPMQILSKLIFLHTKRFKNQTKNFVSIFQYKLRSITPGWYNVIKYRGNKYHCPICCGSFKKLKPFTGSFYIKGKLIDHYTKNAICPKCNADIRHRFLFTFLLRYSNLLQSNIKLLHFAPERGIANFLKKQGNIDYTTCDIEPSRYGSDTLKVDATDIQFSDNTFDAVISSHVLDAIADDTKAIKEIYRILKPGGWTVIAIPIYGETTFEDPSLGDEGRKKIYGIKTHHRMNGLDFKVKLTDAGFAVKIYSLDDVPGNYIDRSDMSPHIESDKYLFLCKK